jgi:hypothetical protein
MGKKQTLLMIFSHTCDGLRKILRECTLCLLWLLLLNHTVRRKKVSLHKYTQLISLVFNGEADNLSSPTCGLTSDKAGSSAFQVYNGKTSMEGAHPWHAFVEVTVNDDFSQSCGGTLIKENVVLTGNTIPIQLNSFEFIIFC